jgi:chromosomal replication initiator protein
MGLPWDGFVVGPENLLAHSSVRALARGEAEGAGTSPLVVHGLSGVGKSRLLEGLVSEWLERRPESSLAHLEAEAFASTCAEAASQPGGWIEVRGRFRALDLLVLDDLHMLERAPLALEELTHTLDALHDRGAVVAVSARSGPGQWRGWPSRLVNRLAGGLAVRVDPPGLASRRRYLLDRARSQKLKLASGAVDLLVDAADGYRTLDGWLVRLGLTSRVERRPIDTPLAQALLAEDGSAPTATGASLDDVARAVARRFGVSIRDLRSSSRRQALAGPRHLAMLLGRSVTGLSFASVGRYFGGRDPATVRHACKAAAERLEADPALASAFEAVQAQWPRHGPEP